MSSGRVPRHGRPIEAFGAPEKPGPIGPRVEAAGYRIRHDKVDTSGSVTLRYNLNTSSSLGHEGLTTSVGTRRVDDHLDCASPAVLGGGEGLGSLFKGEPVGDEYTRQVGSVGQQTGGHVDITTVGATTVRHRADQPELLVHQS